MDIQTLFYNLREEVSCSVCSDVFTDPKHLSCLHSFCLQCLQRWHETCGGGSAIKCPKCQTLSRIPGSGDLKDLPSSFYLNGLIDVLAIKECKNTRVTCGNCEKKTSEASYCFQCYIFYCEECLIGHNIMRDKKEHRVLAVRDFQERDFADVLKRPVFCSRQGHQKEELKLFCKECETAACQTCVMLDHIGHKLKLVEEEAEEQKIEITAIIDTRRQIANEKKDVVVQLDEDFATVIHQSEILKRDIQSFADGLVKTIQAKTKNIIIELESRTEKSLESLSTKKNEIQQQINIFETSLQEAEKLLQRSTKAEVVQLKKSLQTLFREVDQTKPIFQDSGSLEAFVFLKNQKMLEIINEDEIGSLEVSYLRTKAADCLAEGQGLIEGTIGRKAQFSLITRKSRNGVRRQEYDQNDRVTVEILEEQERKCVTEVTIGDNKDGSYSISYFPRVQGTFKLLVKLNEEHIRSHPFSVIVKPLHVKPVFSFGEEGPGDGMRIPRDIAVTDRDEIVVADNAKHRVQVFNSNGALLRSFGREGTRPGEFSYPRGIAVDKDKKIFVSDNHRVQIFSWEGRYLGSFDDRGNCDSKLSYPWGLSFDNKGNVIVADKGNCLIKIFTPDGRFVMKIGAQGLLSQPAHCVQSDEYFIVSDWGEHCVQVFNSEGHFLYSFGKKGEGDGEFNSPFGLLVTQSKHLLVCDPGNQRIQVFELNGTFVAKFVGSKSGYLKSPQFIAVLSNDQFVVSDQKHRVHILKY